ncbi:MAG: hypothetical protein AMS14_05050 [Planctomycetes bacterium DG_20]|nr:MAG: hypothetical protein AMS14_05050 [Planctomycetes bacterium DG_20]
MIRFRCPSCESRMEVDESFAGRPARCPTCGCDLKVPKEGESSPPIQPARAMPRKGATVVTVDGEQVEVVPPLETMVLAAMGFVVLSVVAVLAVGLGRFVTLPWTVGGMLGALLALLGVVIAVPAYHTIRRSRGRKRGRAHAVITMAAGALLFLVFGVIALVGWSQWFLRPTCEENLEKIYQALRAYAAKHDGAFPKSLDDLVTERCLDSPDWLTCPAYHYPIGRQTYIFTSDINVNEPLWPPDLLIVSDGPPFDAHGDGYVRALLLGGDVEHVPIAQWAAYQKSQGDRWNKILNQIRQAKEKAARNGASPPTGAPPSAPAKEAPP